MLDFPLLLSPHGFGENTPPLNTLSLTLCIYMSDSFVVYLHQFFISGRRKKTHSTNASLNMYMSASAVLYRSKPCILVGSIGGNSANLNTGLLYLLQIWIIFLRVFLAFMSLTLSSSIETQQSLGKSSNMGTRNCRHPFQWPRSNIRHIKLNIRMNFPATARNCNRKKQRSSQNKVQFHIQQTWYLSLFE